MVTSKIGFLFSSLMPVKSVCEGKSEKTKKRDWRLLDYEKLTSEIIISAETNILFRNSVDTALTKHFLPPHCELGFINSQFINFPAKRQFHN